MSSFSLSIETIPPLLLVTVLVTGVLAVCFKLAYAGFKKYRQERHNAWLQTHEGKIATLQKQYAAEYKPYQTKQRVRKIIWTALGSVFVAFIIWWFLPEIVRSENIDSRIFMPVFAMLVSAPVFLAIWYFRDQNNLRELERQHQDVTLKEFQQLQEWATGNIADGYKKKGKLKPQAMTLQISALHSLRPFLRGQYGESFKRGAYEIFTSMLKTQHEKILQKIEKGNKPLTREVLVAEIEQQSLTNQLNQIASEEWFCLLIDHDFATAGISLVGVDLSGGKYLRHKVEGKGLDLSYAQFQGANLDAAQLHKADLRRAQLQGACLEWVKLHHANLHGAHLQGANLTTAQLQSSCLINAQLQKSSLLGTELQGSDLRSAKLHGADLHGAQLQCANLDGAVLKGAILQGAQLQGANLNRAELQGAYLQAARLNGIKALNTVFQGVDFRNAQLQGTDLTGVALQGARMDGAFLQGAIKNNQKRKELGLNLVKTGKYILRPLIGQKSDLSENEKKDSLKAMSDDEINVLEQELLKYRNKDYVEQVITQIREGAMLPAETGFCDFSKAKTGFYTEEDAEEWIKEIEKYQTQ